MGIFQPAIVVLGVKYSLFQTTNSPPKNEISFPRFWIWKSAKLEDQQAMLTQKVHESTQNPLADPRFGPAWFANPT